jgi:hypothetical protein
VGRGLLQREGAPAAASALTFVGLMEAHSGAVAPMLRRAVDVDAFLSPCLSCDALCEDRHPPTAVETRTCQFRVQCDPCQPPWVQQTAQRTWDSCGASGPMWAIEYDCALCDG